MNQTTGRLMFGLTLVIFATGWQSPASAAGMTTHALMADIGRKHLDSDHPLHALLDWHRPALLAGAAYPDGGYASGAAFPEDRDVAETAHWQYFVDPLITLLRERGCDEAAATGALLDEGTPAWVVTTIEEIAPLANIQGSDDCGALIAFTMGVAAHGMGDEVWDALFEPVVRERGEEAESSPAFTLDAFPPGADTSVGTLLRGVIGDAPFDALREAFAPATLNSIEYAMDMVAIYENDLWADVPYLVFPPAGLLQAAYDRAGRNNPPVDTLAIQRSALAVRTLVLAERAGAAVETPRIRQQMPWASANYFTGQGGVLHTAEIIAGYYENLWDKLLAGADGAGGPEVVGVHPKHGARAVAADSAAESRVIAFLSSSPDRSTTQPPGAIVVFDDQGRIVPGAAERFGYRGDGSHGLSYGFDGVLAAGKEYTVVVTTRARDERGKSVVAPLVWSFRTAED